MAVPLAIGKATMKVRDAIDEPEAEEHMIDRQLRLRSVLFVPAVRPDRYEKAVATGSDAVCIDLEDAVGPDRKDEARAAALDLLHLPPPERTTRLLRINHPGTAAGEEDVRALVQATARGAYIDALLVPKVSGPEELRRLEGAWGHRKGAPRLAPFVETAQGLEVASQITRAANVAVVLLGGVDLATELGCEIGWDELLYARSRVVHAAALARIRAVDMPFLDVQDPGRLAEEASRAARLGFSGKIAIHPTQVGPIQAAFTPSPTAIERARAVVTAYDRAGGGVALLDGKLIELPVLEAARRTLESADG